MWKWICVGAVTISLFFIKRKMRGGLCFSKVSLNGKTVVITGANCGIGRATAEELAFRGARVILACKNKDAADEAVKSIRERTKNLNVVAKLLDLSSFNSIKNFAADLIETEDKLDILINNAGVFGLPFQLTEENLEIHMAVNHFGHFLLTNLLVNKLKLSAPSKVIIVSSGLSKFGRINFNNLGPFLEIINSNYSETYNAKQAYCDSKLANNLFARELHKRLEGSRVNIYCLRPGMVRSNLDRNVKFPLLFKILLYPLAYLLVKSVKDGCQTVVHCCLKEDEASGKFYADCVEEPWNQASQDLNVAERLWWESERIVGIKR